MISKEEFENNCKEFQKTESKTESRASFYNLANEIIEQYPIQACIIILAVWNVGSFRHIKDREKFLFEFKLAFEKCKPLFKQLEGLDFCSAKFDNEKIQNTVKEIYNNLSKVKGVKYTGASKVMHLLNKDLFIMWDSYINGTRQGVKRYYDGLNLSFKKYITNAEGYVDFLRDMQNKYCHINIGFCGRTFAKCVDENNYITHTKPIQAMEQEEEDKKKGTTRLVNQNEK